MQVIKHDERINLAHATEGSAGYDIQAAIDENIVINPSETRMIPSGISVHIKHTGFGAILLPRSGLGKKGIVLANTVGLIDSDYQGQIMVALRNTGTEPYTVEPLARICQLVFIPVASPSFEYVDVFSNETERGDGGFGSTGVNA